MHLCNNYLHHVFINDVSYYPHHLLFGLDLIPSDPSGSGVWGDP